MAEDRLQYQAPFLSANEMPQVNTDTGAARYMNTLSNVFITNATDAGNRQLASDLDMAKKEGDRVGFENGKNFQPMKADSLFARQYNDSGVTSAMQSVQSTTQIAFADMYAKNKMDPQALAGSMESYAQGYLSKISPDMQTPVKEHMTKMGTALVLQAHQNLREFSQSEAAAKFEQYDHDMDNTLENIAPSMFSGGKVGTAAQESVAQLRQGYITTLAQHGPKAKYYAGGYVVDGTQTGSGALTPVEVAKKLQEFDMKVVSAGVYGNFVKEADKGRGVDAYMTFIKGNMAVTALNKDGKLENMKVSDFLTNEETAKIAEKMRGYSSGIDSMESAVNNKWNRVQDRATDNFKRSAYQAAYETEKQPDGSVRIIGGDPVKLQAIIAAGIKDDTIKPEALKEMQDLAEKIGTGSIDNPVVASNARVLVADGKIANYDDLPSTGISDKTRIDLHKQIDDRLKGEDWTNSVRYKSSTDYAEAVLAPAKSAGFNIFGDNAADKAAAADLAEWKKRMITDSWAAQNDGSMPSNPNAQPLQGQFDFVTHGREIADEIAARRLKPKSVSPEGAALEQKIKDTEAKMNNPQPGDDTKAVAQQYRDLMDQKAQLDAKGVVDTGVSPTAAPKDYTGTPTTPTPKVQATPAPATQTAPTPTTPGTMEPPKPLPPAAVEQHTENIIKDSVSPMRQEGMVQTMQPVIASLVSKGVPPLVIKSTIKQYYAQFADAGTDIGDGHSAIKEGTARRAGRADPAELTTILQNLAPQWSKT